MVRGLTTEQASASRATHGANVLTPPPREPWWKQFLSKFDDPIIRILMIAAGIAIGIGALNGEVAAEGVGIIAAIFLATFLAFWNEFQANKEFDVLNQSNDEVPVKVVRNGVYTTVPRRDLVVGDAVLVEVGEEIPADGRLWEAVSLQVNEGRLTGEAKPARKQPGESDDADGTAYGPAHMLRGTTVVDGYGLYEVTAVGDRSEIGKTLRDSIEENTDPSPLNRQLAGLSQVIGVVGFGIAVLTFSALTVQDVLQGDLTLTVGQWVAAGAIAAAAGVALYRVWLPIVYDALAIAGRESEPPGFLDATGVLPWVKALAAGAVLFVVVIGAGIAAGMVGTTAGDWLPASAAQLFLRHFMIAVTIIVVAVPEGLAMSVTLSLAYSMRKMTASNNLVRRMDACETIGAATVICSDKTGTLTLNEMRVFETTLPDKPDDRRLVAEAMAANSTAHLSREPGKPVTPVGNPTEGALLLWLDEAGYNYIDARTAFAVQTQWTFTTERKFMATLGQSAVLSSRVLHAKGAPEIILRRCTRKVGVAGPVPLTSDDRATVETRLKDYQARGMRTLGFAYTADPGDGTTAEELAEEMIWLGFVAIADPIRAEVPAAIAGCRAAGVGVKMVTGDSPATAREIARQVGLWDDHDPADRLLTGPEFGELSDEAAAAAVLHLKVLARAAADGQTTAGQPTQATGPGGGRHRGWGERWPGPEQRRRRPGDGQDRHVGRQGGERHHPARRLVHEHRQRDSLGPGTVREHPAVHPVPADDQRSRPRDRPARPVHRLRIAADRHADALGEPHHGHVRRPGPGDRTAARRRPAPPAAAGRRVHRHPGHGRPPVRRGGCLPGRADRPDSVHDIDRRAGRSACAPPAAGRCCSRCSCCCSSGTCSTRSAWARRVPSSRACSTIRASWPWPG